jgi:hypothetical protein
LKIAACAANYAWLPLITVEWQIAQKNWSNICSVEHKMMMLKQKTSPLFSRSDIRLVGCPLAGEEKHAEEQNRFSSSAPEQPARGFTRKVVKEKGVP